MHGIEAEYLSNLQWRRAPCLLLSLQLRLVLWCCLPFLKFSNDSIEWKTTQRISGCAGVDTYVLQQLELQAASRWTTRQMTRVLVSSLGLASAVPWLCRVVAMQSLMLLQMQSELVVLV